MPLVGGRQLRSAFLFAGFHFAVTPVLFWTLETFKVSEDAHNRTGQLNSTLPPSDICFLRLLLPDVRLFFLRFYCYVCCPVSVYERVHVCVCMCTVCFLCMLFILLLTRTALTAEPICKELEQM